MIIKNGNENKLKEYMNNKYTIVVVWAEFCGACQMIKTQLEQLVTSREDVTVVELNVDNNQNFVIEKRIIGTPSVFIYKDGNEVDKFVGFLPKEIIEGKLK